MKTLTLNNKISFRSNKEETTRVEKGVILKEMEFESNESVTIGKGAALVAKSNEEITGLITREFSLPRLAGSGLIIRVIPKEDGLAYDKEPVSIEIINAGETSLSLDIGMNLCVVEIEKEKKKESSLKKKAK